MYTFFITARAIDKYIQDRSLQYEDQSVKINPALEQVVQRMFKRCYDSKEFKQAIGIALESFRLDVVEESVHFGHSIELLSYVLEASLNLIQHISFRNKVLHLLVKLYRELPDPDYISTCKCLVHLNDPVTASEIIKKLIAGSEVVLSNRRMIY